MKRIAQIAIFVLFLFPGYDIASAAWNIDAVTPYFVNSPDFLQFSVYYLYRRGNNDPVRTLSNHTVLQVGDLYKILFRPQEECYVYIFQRDEFNIIQQLFPMSSYTGLNPENVNPVRKGKMYGIPNQDSSFEVVPQTGLQDLYFLAFRERNLFLEEHYQAMLIHQLQQDDMRSKFSRDKLLGFFESKSASRIVTEVQNSERDDGSAPLATRVAGNFAVTEQQILDALNVVPSSTKGQIKGIIGIEKILQNDALLNRMPKTVAFLDFREGSAEIEVSSYPLLQKYGRVLQNELPESVVVIAGHANEEKSVQENHDVSYRRAEAVRQFLLSNFSIEAQRLLVKPYGASKPILSDGGNLYNNRIEFIRVR